MVMEVVQEDMGDGSMQCTDHPYKNSTPGGICAFCLQEKLGKLVSSSFPVAIFPSSSSSPSPSFRSVADASSNSSSLAVSIRPPSAKDCEYYNSRRSSRVPFHLTTNRRKKKSSDSSSSTAIVFKRSKSTTTPRRGGIQFLDAEESEDFSPHKKGFWSFLYLTKNSSTSSSKKGDKSFKDASSYASSSSVSRERDQKKKEDQLVVVDENDESPDQQSADRKVSRSRSVGCGSRSFSGDFFERISTGFGDCTLRRVESQREGKPKVPTMHRNSSTNAGQDCIKERVKCGGIFSGFMITSSSSSSSSSSYWVSSSAEENNNVNNGGRSVSTPGSARQHLAHGRSKSWGFLALASPMRAFGKPSSNGKRDSNKNATPNLAAIPSLLAAR